MKSPIKIIALLLVFAFICDASARQRQRGGRQRQTLGPNAQTFDLEEFSPQGDESTKEIYALRYGQYAPTSNEPDEKVKAYPKLKSEKPVYGSFTLDDGFFPSNRPGATFCFVVDESQGTGKGYDRFYLDLNNDFDLTNDKPVKPTEIPEPPKQTASGGNVIAATRIVSSDEAASLQIIRPTDITFETLTITLTSSRSGRGSRDATPTEIKLIPEFTSYGDDFTNVSLIPATARRGKIKIGDQELNVYLARSPYITSSFNNPNTGLYFGADYDYLGVLGKIRKINGKLYQFSASRDGSRLIVAPYEGEYGIFQIGNIAGKLKNAKFDEGQLISRRTLIDLKDCPTDGDKIKIPIGNYSPMSLNFVSDILGTNFSQANPDADAAFNLNITADKPFTFDFSHKLKIVFDSPDNMHQLKPGENLSVSAMMNIPDLNMQMMGLDDRTKPTKTGITFADGTEYIRYASLDPDVKITNASGKVVAEGKMPFG
ncbi:MAG: hypothetical protein GY869_06575 [Planctomycetes bacterium]|nr:hypothetical protein [Planctomycetota bacterium]